MTADAVLAELRGVVTVNGSQKEAARVLGISASYLCDLLAERREVSAEVAELLGFRRVVTYEPLRTVPAVESVVGDSNP